MALSSTQRRVKEKTTPTYSATITSNGTTPIPASSLSTLTVTLFDKDTEGVINSRNNQNCLNANQVTVDESGLLTWEMQPADNEIISSSLGINRYETHFAIFTWTYDGGNKTGRHQVTIEVLNLGIVT